MTPGEDTLRPTIGSGALRSDPLGLVLAGLAAVATLATIVAGSWIHSHLGGLAVPDWPTTYGRWLPWAWQGNAIWVTLHRLVAGLSGILVVLLAVWLTRRPPRPWMRRLGIGLLILNLVQIGLGGVAVLSFLPSWLVAVHVLLAQAIFAGLVLAAVAAVRWRSAADSGLARRARFALGMLMLQVILGSLARHPPHESVYLFALGLHVVGAFAVVGWLKFLVGGVASSGRKGPLAWSVYGLLGLAVVQLMVGMTTLFKAPAPNLEIWPPPVGFPLVHAAHQSIAALLLALALVATVVLSVGDGDG